MSVLERPHYVIKPTDLARWLDQEPETWWIVNFDPRLTGTVDFPCPSDELSDALRSYHRDLFVYPIGPASPKPNPSGQPIEWERLGDLFDRDGARRQEDVLALLVRSRGRVGPQRVSRVDCYPSFRTKGAVVAKKKRPSPHRSSREDQRHSLAHRRYWAPSRLAPLPTTSRPDQREPRSDRLHRIPFECQVPTIPASKAKHMGHLRRLVLANLIETFERFIKELAAVCIDQLASFVTDDRYNTFTAKGNEIIAHFEAGSIGKRSANRTHGSATT